jgi:hypothetical protein
MKKKSEAVIAAIKADLHIPEMNYMIIAIKHGVGLSKVNQVAKANGLTRPRGPRPQAKG